MTEPPEQKRSLAAEIADEVMERVRLEEKSQAIQPGVVVQITATSESMYAWCFMLVTDISEEWVEGFVWTPRSPTLEPNRESYRARWKEVEFIGEAVWLPEL